MITLLKHDSDGTWEIDFDKLNLEGIECPLYEISIGINAQLFNYAFGEDGEK